MLQSDTSSTDNPITLSGDPKTNTPKESKDDDIILENVTTVSAADCTSSVEDKISTEKKTSSASQESLFSCRSCKKVYTTRAGLYKHNRTYHPNMTIKSITCSEPECRCVFKGLQQYRNHLLTVHGIPMEVFIKEFKDHHKLCTLLHSFKSLMSYARF